MIHQDRYVQASAPRDVAAVRLLVITPVHPVDGREGPFPLASSERYLLFPQTVVDEVLCIDAPAPISQKSDFETVIPMVVEKGIWAETEGYHAVVLNCMVDPGLEELQRELKIPVIGAGRAAAGLASIMGDRLSVLFPNSVFVNDFAKRKEAVMQELQTVACRQIGTRGVNVLAFECAYLGGAANELQESVGVPVMATTEVALRMAETIVLLGIKPEAPRVTSRRVSKFKQLIFRAKDNLLNLKLKAQEKAGIFPSI